MAEFPDEADVEKRSQLLPEEQGSASDDAEEQARVILEESEDRTENPERTQHESVQTPDHD
jgi:hypothetical protein